MKKNEGNMDRVLRILLGAGAVAWSDSIGFSTAWGVVLLVVAAVMVLTAASGFCPAYKLLHPSTIPDHTGGRATKGHFRHRLAR